MSILVINAGSTSLKFGLFDGEARETLVSGTIDWADGNRQRAQFLLRRGSHEKRSVVAVPDDHAAATCAVQALAAEGDITVVGHRVVNGGSEIRDSVLIDDALKGKLTDALKAFKEGRDKLNEMSPHKVAGGVYLAIDATVTPLWIGNTVGLGLGGDIGWKYDSLSASNGSVDMSRFPLDLWAQTLIALSDSWYVHLLAGPHKESGVNLSGSGVDRGMLELCLECVGAERLLWGTDLTMDTGWAKLRALEAMGLDHEALEGIRWKTAARLFRLSL